MPPALIVLVALVFAGAIVFSISMRANSRRAQSGRAMLRSIPEAITRAKQRRGHVLVFFLDPEDERTPALLDLAFDPGLARKLETFERVRVDAPVADLDVVQAIAAKYGMTKVDPPSLLALDRDGRRLESVGPKDLGLTPEERRERFEQFLDRARARF